MPKSGVRPVLRQATQAACRGEFAVRNNGQQCTTCWPTARRVIELRKAETTTGQGIERWCVDLATVTTEIGIAQVISQNEHNIGFFADSAAKLD